MDISEIKEINFELTFFNSKDTVDKWCNYTPL